MKYPNPSKRYVVFTDALDQAATAVLTQEYIGEDRETKRCQLPTFLCSSPIPILHGVL